MRVYSGVRRAVDCLSAHIVLSCRRGNRNGAVRFLRFCVRGKKRSDSRDCIFPVKTADFRVFSKRIGFVSAILFASGGMFRDARQKAKKFMVGSFDCVFLHGLFYPDRRLYHAVMVRIRLESRKNLLLRLARRYGKASFLYGGYRRVPLSKTENNFRSLL